MKLIVTTAALAAAAIVAGCGKPAQTVRVDCGSQEIILSESVAAAVRADMSGSTGDIAIAACELVKSANVDTSGGPVNATVKSSAGNEYAVQIVPSAD